MVASLVVAMYPYFAEEHLGGLVASSDHLVDFANSGQRQLAVLVVVDAAFAFAVEQPFGC